MLKRLAVAALFAAGVAVLGSVSLKAGEFGGGSAAAPGAAPGVTVDANPEAVAVYPTDPAVKTVYETQAAKNDVVYDDTMGETAQDLVNKYMESKNYQMGWDPDTGRFFACQIGTFDTENPAADPHFLDKRDIAVKEAILRAKADIINFIKTEMSAYDRLRTPGTIANDELGAEYETLSSRIRDLARQVAPRVQQFYGAEEAAVLLNSPDDRKQLDAVKTSLDRMTRDLSQRRIPFDLQAEIGRQQSLHEDLVNARNKLAARAEAIMESDETQSETYIKRFSEMALTGATVIQQAESWDRRKRYEAAVLMCWSHNLERMARATLTGLPVEMQGKVGTISRNAWVNSRDLSAMSGVYQFLDDKGRFNFIGIAAQPVGNNAREEQRNRSVADMLAGQMAAFGLFADVKAYSEFQRIDTFKNFQESISQAINKLEIRGMQIIRRAKVRHPDLNIEMQVSVCCINAKDAEAAMEAEAANVRAAIAVKKYQASLRGRSEEFRQQLDKAGSDANAYKTGQEGARSAAARNPDVAKPGQPQTKNAAPRPFTRMSENVDDDF